jgi:hypothetical protein
VRVWSVPTRLSAWARARQGLAARLPDAPSHHHGHEARPAPAATALGLRSTYRQMIQHSLDRHARMSPASSRPSDASGAAPPWLVSSPASAILYALDRLRRGGQRLLPTRRGSER